MINIAIDFNEIQAKKFGADYKAEEHLKEIFPALQSDSEDEGKEDPVVHIAKKIKLARQDGEDEDGEGWNGGGEGGEAGVEQQGQDERDPGQLVHAGGHGELQQ